MMKYFLTLTLLLVILAATTQAGRKGKGNKVKPEKEGGKKCKQDLKAATQAVAEAQAALTAAESAKAAAENVQAGAEKALAAKEEELARAKEAQAAAESAKAAAESGKAAAESGKAAAESAKAAAEKALAAKEQELAELKEAQVAKSSKSCKTLLDSGKTTDGVYTINPTGSAEVQVYCDMTNGGYTVIQRRVDASVDFYRGWNDYVLGFGDPSANFWAGLDNINALASCVNTDLVVTMTTFEGQTAEARYTAFMVEGSASGYRMTVSGYSGNAGNAMAYHNGMKFTTKDRDHDTQAPYNCAERFKGAFWYQACHQANPNGIYKSTVYGEGINWLQMKGFKYSMKTIEFKVRSTCA